MRRKKLVTFMLATAMTVTMIVGCGNDTKDVSSQTSTNQTDSNEKKML